MGKEFTALFDVIGIMNILPPLADSQNLKSKYLTQFFPWSSEDDRDLLGICNVRNFSYCSTFSAPRMFCSHPRILKDLNLQSRWKLSLSFHSREIPEAGPCSMSTTNRIRLASCPFPKSAVAEIILECLLTFPRRFDGFVIRWQSSRTMVAMAALAGPGFRLMPRLRSTLRCITTEARGSESAPVSLFLSHEYDMH